LDTAANTPSSSSSPQESRPNVEHILYVRASPGVTIDCINSAITAPEDKALRSHFMPGSSTMARLTFASKEIADRVMQRYSGSLTFGANLPIPVGITAPTAAEYILLVPEAAGLTQERINNIITAPEDKPSRFCGTPSFQHVSALVFSSKDIADRVKQRYSASIPFGNCFPAPTPRPGTGSIPPRSPPIAASPAPLTSSECVLHVCNFPGMTLHRIEELITAAEDKPLRSSYSHNFNYGPGNSRAELTFASKEIADRVKERYSQWISFGGIYPATAGQSSLPPPPPPPPPPPCGAPLHNHSYPEPPRVLHPLWRQPPPRPGPGIFPPHPSTLPGPPRPPPGPPPGPRPGHQGVEVRTTTSLEGYTTTQMYTSSEKIRNAVEIVTETVKNGSEVRTITTTRFFPKDMAEVCLPNGKDNDIDKEREKEKEKEKGKEKEDDSISIVDD